MTCRCDTPRHPAALAIPPGLPRIPRAIARFGGFRAALLADAAARPALAAWRARGGDDLGVMLLEFAAYVAAVQAFYDEVQANESYLRTALRDASVAALVGSLGYVPRPAVAASVWLALEPTGRGPVALAAGSAFRSAAFAGSAPQVFETGAAAVLRPERSRLSLARGAARLSGSGSASEFLVGRSTALLPGAVVAVRSPAGTTAHRVVSLTDNAGGSGRTLLIDPPAALPAEATAEQVAILASALEARLWSAAPVAGDPAAADADARVLVLDGLHRALKPGDTLIGERSGELRADRVAAVRDVARTVHAAGLVKAENEDGDEVEVSVPAVTTLATEVTLVSGLNAVKPGGAADWGAGDAATLRLRFGLSPAAALLRAPATGLALAAGATLPVLPMRMAPEEDWSAPVALSDARNRSAVVDAAFEAATRRLTLGAVPPGLPVLEAPITVRGNLVAATRGETVALETLGSGDASRASQAFVLKKSPLTHLATASGIAPALEVRVDGFLWQRVPSFYGRGPAERIYVLRCDRAGVATITFGDGLRGARLPSGTGNVTARYRHGAGALAPPAGAITQPASAIARLGAVRQPEDAFGGADAEGPELLRTAAPRSALLLDRIVSRPDAEALAQQQPGVAAARADWAWLAERQRPMLRILYIGADDLAPLISAALRAAADPALPVAVVPAIAAPLSLSIGFATAPGLAASERVAAVRAVLTDPADGLLAPARIGLEAPLYRSALVAAVLSVPDVVSVTDLAVGGVAFPDFALPPVEGGYHDVAGRLSINGELG